MDEFHKFSDFEEFDKFMKKMRLDNLDREEHVFSLPILFRIDMSIPVDFGLILSTIIYSTIHKN